MYGVIRGEGVVHCVARLTRYWSVMSANSIKGSRCFLKPKY